MRTLTIKKSTTSYEEVEIKLPYYCKSSGFYHKIINQKEAIQVCALVLFYGIQITQASTALHKVGGNENEQITKEEFEEVFKLVNEKLNNILEHGNTDN